MDAQENTVLLNKHNYFTWIRQIEKAFRDHDLVPHEGNFPDNYCSKNANDRASSAKAALLIFTTVSHEVLHLVPATSLLDPRLLLADLTACFGSFRFCDLPAELRNRIYEHCFEELPEDNDNTSHFDFGGGHFLNKYEGHPSGITQVSKQLRHETRKLYFATRCFSFKFWHLRHVPVHDHGEFIAAKIRQWAEQVGGTDLRYLRKLKVCKGRYDMAATIEFSEEKGLEVKPYEITGYCGEQIKRLLPAAEANRKALSLKGESIIMLLLQDPEIWRPVDGLDPPDDGMDLDLN